MKPISPELRAFLEGCVRITWDEDPFARGAREFVRVHRAERERRLPVGRRLAKDQVLDVEWVTVKAPPTSA